MEHYNNNDNSIYRIWILELEIFQVNASGRVYSPLELQTVHEAFHRFEFYFEIIAEFQISKFCDEYANFWCFSQKYLNLAFAGRNFLKHVPRILLPFFELSSKFYFANALIPGITIDHKKMAEIHIERQKLNSIVHFIQFLFIHPVCSLFFPVV